MLLSRLIDIPDEVEHKKYQKGRKEVAPEHEHGIADEPGHNGPENIHVDSVHEA